MVIRDPAAGAVFASSKMRRLLMLFAPAPLSLSEAAQRTNMDLKRLHHHVQRLVGLGLLHVAREQPRPGRAIKLYQAINDVFFVPDEVMPKPFAHEMAVELRELLHAEALRSSRGLLLTVGAKGEPHGRIVAAEEVSPDAFELWRILKLDASEVEQLRSEIDAVLQKYQGHARRHGKVYLVHGAAARRRDETGAADNAGG